MTAEPFDLGLDAAQRRLADLARRADTLPPAHQALIREIIETASISLEELNVAAEELHQQNQELLAARSDLEAERRRYRDLFELAPDGYLVTDPGGMIRDANQAAVDLLNVPRVELVGKPLVLYLAPEDWERFHTYLDRLGAGRGAGASSAEREMHVRPRHRPPFPAALTVAPIRDAGGKLTGHRWLLRDITATKRAEERNRLLEQIQQDRAAIGVLVQDLEQERQTLQTIMENTPAQLAYLDPGFNFVRVNAAYVHGSGHNREKLLGRNHFDLFPNAENEAIFEGVRDIGQPVYYHARPFEYADQPERGVTYWDWSLVPVEDAQGAVQGLVFSLLDVTEAELARQERERYLARLNRLIEATQEILAERTPAAMLDCVVGAARELTGAHIGVAGHAFEEGAFRLEAASQSDALPPCPPAASFVSEKGGVYLDLLAKQPSIRLTDEELRSHPAWWGLPDSHTPLRGLLGARMVGGDGQPSGFVMVSHKEQGEFTAEDEALLVQLATLASLGLRHIEARDDAERRANELSATFGAMNDAVMVFDAAGIGVRANAAVARLYGLDPTQVDLSTGFLSATSDTAGRSLLDADGAGRIQALNLRYPDGRPLLADELPSARSLRGERVANEPLCLTNSQGEEFIVLASASPLLAGDQLWGVVVLHDVTERERLLEENRRQREFLERLMAAAPVGIAVVRGPDHRYEFVNPYYQAIPGGRDLPMAGRAVEEVFPHVAATGLLELVEEVYRTGEPRSLREFEATFGSNSEPTYWNVDHVPLWNDGTVDGVLILASEVTAEVQARQEVERLAARDEAILTSMTEGVIVFDLEGNILSMNPAALRIHGFERPEQARRHLLQYPDVFELRYLDGRLMAVDEWPAARVLRGERFTAYEARVRRVDTGQAWIGSYSGTPVLDREGHPILGVLTLHDVTARKVAEAERQRLLGQLDAERARLAAIIDHAPEAIVVTDPSSHLVLANPATERLYGRPIPSGQGLADQADLVLCHPDGTPYEAHDLPLSRSALDGQVHANLEMALFRPGGERRDLLVSTAPILDSRGRVDGVVGIFQDTTERKQIQEAIQRYAARLQTLHDVDQAILAAESTEAIAQIALTHVRGAVGCVRASVALFDLEAGEAILLAVITDGETALPKGWRGPITGEWPVEQLRGGEISAVEDLSTVQPSMPLYENLLAEGVRSLAHLPLIAEDTLIGALNLGLPEPGGPTREQVDTAREMAAGLAISIRHSQLHAQVRRHAQELEQQVARRTAALQASQARLRAIFDGAAIGIALSDLEGRILDSNPAFRAMLGYSSQELSGLVFTEVTHPEDAAADLALFRELLAGQRDDYHLEKRYLRKDGQVLWANLTVSLVRRDEGDPVFAIGLVEDITERKQMQEALFQAEKLTIAGQLGASLAHEINNPLQAVIGCLGLAENTLQTGGDVSRYLEVAREELRRAARIVAQLRDLHRLSKEEPQERVDLNALLEEVLMLSRKKCQESGVEVVWEPAADLPPLPLVSDQVRQVFLNLILNALDAMPHGGELRVGTAWTGDPAGTHVTFADTGAGISPHALSRLFEPFFTTKPRGLGLGLYISHQIVEEHGGRIDVASQVGQGTTFTVWLPGS